LLRVHSLITGQPRTFTLGLRYQWGGVTGDPRIRNGGRRGEMFDGQPRGGDRGGFGPGGPGGSRGGMGPGGGPGF
jgi:hypothetical protein